METHTRRKTDIPLVHEEWLLEHLRNCLGLWQLEELAPKIEMRISRRMTRTIGSANLAKNRITLADWLFDQPVAIIEEVLCHEAAHLAVHDVHGPGCRPHGREWQAMMRRAGRTPRVRIPLPNPPPMPTIRRRRKTAFGKVAAALIRW